MSLYSSVRGIVDGLSIGEVVSISIPDKLGAFRKFLCEISSQDHKKFTTKVKDGLLHIMRIQYHSVTEKIVK